jgi:hypothetical protein
MEFEEVEACITTLRANLAEGDPLGLLADFKGLREVMQRVPLENRG